MGVVHGLDDNHDDDHIIADADDDDDDADVPSIEVDTAPHCVDNTEKGSGNSLVAAGEQEDIWAFIDFDACM
ncbi:hypothetical protein PAXRUDRAFT_20656 [Paxillus rubicundulus Ve08.2h10]|uniref:Uncharacterized protein n=1 Tax=Paxillus rubicundulus Ve08.2h10 TaxID=930991 RepID=A0A0D0BQ27_9AGAM|nr:hypothetical protein PAXRUDRAFT_20656 [Paxillus rubicundulus Ve08.2h10]